MASAWHQLFGLSLNLEIKPVEILGTLLSAYLVYLAATLQTALTAKSSNDRVEKDILLRSLHSCDEHLGNVRTLFTKEVADIGFIHPGALAQITAGLRLLSNSIEQLEVEIKMSRFSDFETRFEMLKELLFAYKSTTTDLPLGEYKAELKSNEWIHSSNLRNALVKFIFELNVAEPKARRMQTQKR